MISNEILQYLFFTAVGSVALLALWYIFIKAPQARSRALEPWARKRGLTFVPPVSLGSHTTGLETSVLQGNVQGVPLTLRSSRLVNSRRAGISGTTEIHVRAFAPTPWSFQVLCDRGRAPGCVPTGDMAFDAHVGTRTDNPQAAVAWLNPQVRMAIHGAIAEFAPISCAYANGQMTLRFEKPISDEPGLDQALALAVAAAHARLA